MLGEADADALRPEMAQDRPELQRPEPPAELHAGVHQVADRARFRRPQVVGRQRERRAHDVHAAAVERAEVERREEPLVRVDHEGVRPAAAVEDVLRLRDQGRDPGVGRVDVQPQALVRAEAGDGVDRVDAGGRGGAHRGDHRQRGHAARAVGRDRLPQRVGPHAELRVRRDPGQRVVAESERHDRLVDRRMRLFGGVDAQRPEVRAPGQPPRADAGHRPVPGRGQRVQAGDGRRVVDDPLERVGQAEKLPQPAQRHLFELGRGGRRPPQHRLHVQGGRQELGEHPGGGARDGEVGEEARVVPVGDAGQDDPLEVAEDLVERDAGRGRGRRQRAAHRARRTAGEDRIALGVVQVAGYPVDEGVAVPAERLGVHVAEARRFLAGHRVPPADPRVSRPRRRTRARTPSAGRCATRSPRPRPPRPRPRSRPASRA